MRILHTFRGRQFTSDFPAGQIWVGRPTETAEPDLDLSPDHDVSRRHARVWEQAGRVWLEDLGSRAGTFVNGQRVAGAVEIMPDDAVSLGDTILQIFAGHPEIPVEDDTAAEVAAGNYVYATPMDSKPPTAAATPAPAALFSESFAARLALLMDLLAQTSRRQTLEAFLGAFLGRIMTAVPDAERGALLLLEPETKQLVLKAYVSASEPAVSDTLSRKALLEQKGFVWRRNVDRAPSNTALQLASKAALYAPLVWQERTLGVLCLDNTRRDLAFTDDDLKLISAAAQLGAAAIAAQDVQERLLFKAGFYQRLLYQFSPETLGNLAARVQREAVLPQAIRSEVTLLAIHFGHAPEVSPRVQPEGATAWWLAHFELALDLIHASHGAVARVGESELLAVFSSPEADPQQHEHALRAALALRGELAGLQTRLTAKGEPAGEFRLALHTGSALHGLFGSARRMVFQVLGEPVATVNALAKAAGPGEILASRETFQHIYPLIQSHRLTVALDASAAATEVYRVQGLREKG